MNIDVWFFPKIEHFVLDFSDTSAPGFVAEGPVDPIEKDDVEYVCAVTKVNFTNSNKWFFKNISGDITKRIPAEDIKGKPE